MNISQAFALAKYKPLNFRQFFCLFMLFAVTGIIGNGTATHAATLSVSAGGDFQAALNAARGGDTITLEAGATFIGPFTLPYKAGTNTDADYITITSSRAAELPAAGERITPAHAQLLPKLVTPGRGDVALKTAPGAHHYRLIGIEVGLATEDALAYDLIQLGDGGWAQYTDAAVPHHLVIDRCYIHGNPTMDLKRGIALNSAHTEILNSYISDVHVKGQEAQAVAGWNGPGPFKIINNYLEGAGTNLFFGGSTGGLPNLVPADIEIRRNHLRKPMEWRGRWTVKNLFELKNARRVVVSGNVFENNWVDAQSGQAILFTPRPNDSGPAAVVEDVEFTNNVIRNVAGGFSILGKDYLYTADPTSVRLRRVRIANNLITGIDAWGLGGGYGAFILISDGTDSVTVEHNTVWPARSIILTNGAA
ncbi:MAG: right-handed parallel beta-helix repeat-containing protein, partial [Pyrinomonadaceae bacterium]|nr:right-handed parallel beta-helix repeat-containing protein [Pyrinomonadaceae bacterium]